MPRKRKLTKKQAADRQKKAKRDYARSVRTSAREITIGTCANRARRKRLLKCPIKFLKGYFGPKPGADPSKRQNHERFYRPFSDDQIEAIKLFVFAAQTGQDEIVLAPRGDWKTETVKHLIIYLIAAEIIRFPVIIGPNGDHAAELFKDIKNQMVSPVFAADYPEIADPIKAILKGGNPKYQTCQGELTNLVWNESEIRLADIKKVPGVWKPSKYGGVRMLYRGMDASIRGINRGGARPDFAFADDIETEESARSRGPKGQIQTRRAVIEKAVAGLNSVDPVTRLILGTVQNDYCLTYQLWKEWGGKRYQAVKVWPENAEGGEVAAEYRDRYVMMRRKEKAAGVKDFKESYAFYVKHRKKIERGVVMGNPHNYSTKPRDPAKPNGPKIHVSAFHRVCNYLAEENGLNYVLTEFQNDPPESAKPTDLGLTYTKVMSRISGFRQMEIHPDARAITAAVDLGRYLCHWSIWCWLEGMSGLCVNHGVIEVDGLGVHSSDEHQYQAQMRALNTWRLQLMRLELSEQMPSQVLIDSSDFTSLAYAFIRESADGTGTFKAVKGLSPYRTYQDIPGQQVVGRHFHGTFQGENNIWLYRLDSDELKRLVHLGWSTPTFDEAQQFQPMALSLYSAFAEDGKTPDNRRHLSFGKHQTAEKFETEFVPGRGRTKGKQQGWNRINPNNHQFDTTYYSMAGAFMENVWLPLDTAPEPDTPAPTEAPEIGAGSAGAGGRFRRPGRPFLTRRN